MEKGGKERQLGARNLLLPQGPHTRDRQSLAKPSVRSPFPARSQPQDKCRNGLACICEEADSRGQSSQVEAGHPSLPSAQEPWAQGTVRLTRLPHHHSI